MAGFFDLTGQVALGTGAGQGIGAGTARRLHSAGARIAVFDRDVTRAESVAAGLEGLRGDITVNAISPAVIRTQMLEGLAPSTVEYMIAKIPIGRTGTIDEVAALVHYLASPEASFTTGQCYDISGGRATY